MTHSSMPIETLAANLSATEQDQLKRGEAIVTGDNGNYTAMVLVKASVEATWDVLTDYEGLEDFLPNVTSSRVVAEQGDRKIVERVDTRNVLFMELESTTRTESVEKAPDQIDFRLVEGDHLKQLDGRWRVQPVESADSPAVLISQTVAADADAGILQGTFEEMFASSLKESLEAIRSEVERRSQP
jgi:ribosome-associated toxin RatA of RatAB toxin-antitoxin module